MDFSAATTLTAADWKQWPTRNVAVENGGIALDFEPSVTVDRLSLSAIDLTVDADGSLYTLRSSGVVYRHNRHRGIEHELWRPESALREPQAICVSGDRLYVVGETGTVAVIAVRLQQQIGTIETDAEPVTVTAADGRLYLLDSRSGAVLTLQSDGSLKPVFDSLSSPIDMTVDETGTIYVLDDQADHRDVQKQASTGEILDGQILVGRHRCLRKQTTDGETDPGRFPLSSFETAAGESVTPTRLGTAVESPLLLAGRTDSDETVVVDLDLETAVFSERQRLDGACRVFRTPVASTDGVSYAVVGEERCLRLDPTSTHARCPGHDSYCGHAYQQFDAGSSIQWHRLTVDSEIPTASTRLRVSYLASDEASPLEESLSAVTGLDESVLAAHGVDTVWDLLSATPRQLATHSEDLSVAEAAEALDAALSAVETAHSGEWQTAESDGTDLLLSEAHGQYLTVRLDLLGSPTVSPHIRSLRAIWPRQSYLDYLPEIYQDDSSSAAFLEQFLSVFGTVFTDIEGEIASVTQYLDPAAVPADSLPWLADWIGTDAPVDWPTAAVRDLVASAPQRYRNRGTRDGLRDLLILYLRHVAPPDDPPADWMVPSESALSEDDLSGFDHGLRIIEPQDLDEIESAAVRDAYESHLSGPQSVAVYAGPFADAEHRAAVAEIIRRETPAHVQDSLVELEPEFTLGADSFLGSNTRLSERRLELGETALGTTAVLE